MGTYNILFVNELIIDDFIKSFTAVLLTRLLVYILPSTNQIANRHHRFSCGIIQVPV